MNIFEFVVVHRPKERKGENQSATPQILVYPSCVLARDEKHAAMLAARAVPDMYADKLDEVDVAVRPF